MPLYKIIFSTLFIFFNLSSASYPSKYDASLGMRVYDREALLADRQPAFPTIKLLIGGLSIIAGLIGKFIQSAPDGEVEPEPGQPVAVRIGADEEPAERYNRIKNTMFMLLVTLGIAGGISTSSATPPFWLNGFLAGGATAVYSAFYSNVPSGFNEIVTEMRKKLTFSNVLLGAGAVISWYALAQYQKEQNSITNESEKFFKENADLASQAWRMYYPALNSNINDNKVRESLLDAMKKNPELKISLQRIIKHIQEKDKYFDGYAMDVNDHYELKKLAEGLWKVAYYQKLKEKALTTMPSPEGFFTDFELKLWNRRYEPIDFNNKN